MLIIDEKYVIAHMKKCGGTSVCKGLIEALEPERVKFLGYTSDGEERSKQSRRKKGLWKHSSAVEIVNNIPYARENLIVYLISTRPWWDRVGSFYYHAQRHNKKNPTKYPWSRDLDLSDFSNSRHLKEVEKLDDFSTDEEGTIQVDYFIDYNELGEWYASFAAELGKSDAVLPFYNAGEREQVSSYRNQFHDDDIKALEKHFSGEVEMRSKMRKLAPGVLILPK